MASSVAGHVRAFGEDIVPGCYDDIEAADLVVLVGSNTAWCHPVLYQRLVAAREKRGTKIVAIDPRHTRDMRHRRYSSGHPARIRCGGVRRSACSSCRERGLRPGMDARIRRPDLPRQPRSRANTRSSVADVAQIADVPVGDLVRFYDLFAATERALTLYSQGTNQSSSGTDKVNAIINCHLATGRIGRPGMGPFSLTGQPNAMGGREVGGLANQLAAHMSFADPRGHRSRAPFLVGAAHGDAAGTQGRRAVRRRARRHGQGAVDSQYQSGRQHAARRAGARGAGRLSVRRRQRLLADRYDVLCRHRPAGGGVGREGRHRHQFGTLHFAAARLPCAAGRSAARLVDDGGGGAAHGVGRCIYL